VIKKVFIDTDIILDVAMARKPFFSASRTILAMAETGMIHHHAQRRPAFCAIR
jgi:hypothetical protein